MDSDQPPPRFDREGIDPTVLTLWIGHEAVAGLPDTESPLDHLSGASRPWIVVAEEPFSQWSEFASSTEHGLEQDVHDDGFQFSQNWPDLAPGSSMPQERYFPSQILDQAFFSSDNSSKPSQSAPPPDADEYRLDSSKTLSYTSSDNEWPVVTPTTSTDGQTPAASEKDEKAASRKRTRDEIKEMTTTFPIRDSQHPAGRTKKVYSPRRRKEVAMARQMGACVRCRFRKVSVSHCDGAFTNPSS